MNRLAELPRAVSLSAPHHGPLIGVLGGMGPAATADFMTKLVAVTPAQCDQEHLPVLVASLPQIPDRSRAILGNGPDPLPAMLAGIDLLSQAGAGVIAVPCNTAHNWHAALARHSRVPVLHIAQASVAALRQHPAGQRAVLLATRGTVQAGVYQPELQDSGIPTVLLTETAQLAVDGAIAAVKRGEPQQGAVLLHAALSLARELGANIAVLACTELPLAAALIEAPCLQMIDTTLELARYAVQHGLRRGWNIAPMRLSTQTV